MVILKFERFTSATDVTKFININKIKKEDVLSLSQMFGTTVLETYELFFYGDSETKEINRGFFGW